MILNIFRDLSYKCLDILCLIFILITFFGCSQINSKSISNVYVTDLKVIKIEKNYMNDIQVQISGKIVNEGESLIPYNETMSSWMFLPVFELTKIGDIDNNNKEYNGGPVQQFDYTGGKLTSGGYYVNSFTNENPFLTNTSVNFESKFGFKESDFNNYFLNDSFKYQSNFKFLFNGFKSSEFKEKFGIDFDNYRKIDQKPTIFNLKDEIVKYYKNNEGIQK